MKLRTHLVRLVLLSVAPLVVFSGFVVLRNLEEQRRLRLVGSHQTARALSLAVDRQVQVAFAVLDTLAASPDLEKGDLARFHEACARLTERRDGGWIVLFDETGQQVLNSKKPLGTRLPNILRDGRNEPDPDFPLIPVGGAGPFQDVFATGKRAVSNLFVDLDTGWPILAAAIPVLREGRVAYVLGMAMDPDSFLKIVEDQGVPPAWTVSILDGDRLVIARTVNSSAMVGRRLSPDLDGHITAGDSNGVGETLEGVRVYHTFLHCGAAPWLVSIGASKDDADSHADLTVALLWSAAGFTVLLALGIALLMGMRMTKSIAALSSAAPQLALGEDPPPLNLEVREFRELHDELAKAGRRAREATVEHERRLAAEAQREESRRADKAKDDFLAMLGHELRNPLTVIVASARVARKFCEGSPDAAKATERIEHQAMHAARIINDLVDLSRVTLGMLELELESTDLGRVAQDVVSAWRSAGRLDRHEVTVEAGTAWARADRTRMEQVLSNLLDNAVKFTPAGGRIAVTAGTEDGSAVLRVRDTGSGIPPDIGRRIFELHVTGDRSRDRVSMGIGLALVKRLVELHGGTVAAASEGEGRGAELTVRIPGLKPE
jgi:signal transduction histidine kinase